MANDSGSQMSGWLYRREKRKSWKRLWFVLKEQILYTYKASEDVVALNTLPVLGYSVQSFPVVSTFLMFIVLYCLLYIFCFYNMFFERQMQYLNIPTGIITKTYLYFVNCIDQFS